MSEVKTPQEVVEGFLADTCADKREQLMGITMDRKYYTSIVGDKDVDSLREQLSLEQSKVLKEKDRVLSDNRDIDVINALNKEIDAVEKAKGEIDRLDQMETGIRKYLTFIDKPTDETKAELLAIANL